MSQFIADQVTELKAELTAMQTAYRAILSGGRQSYKIDTGQGITEVTHHNINTLRTAIISQIDTIELLDNRRTGEGVSIGRAAF